jgi:aminopeptidase YwaD
MNVNKKRLWKHVTFLCKEIGPRLSGTPAEERAVEHIAEHFRRCGAEVEVQSFPCPSWEHDSTQLMLLGAGRAKPLRALAQTFTEACEVEAELAAVGTWHELEFAPDLEGKALVLHGSAASGLALDRNVTLLTAEERRAAALIVVSPAETVSSKLTRDPRLRVPSVGVSQSVGIKLLQNKGRQVRLKVRARRYASTGHTVIGRLQGEEQGHVVVAAHHDTAAYCPGAADNASGVAAMLEVCELLAAARGRKLGIHFVSYGGHEYGRHRDNLGSVEYVRRHPADVAQARGILEADSVGTAEAAARVRVAGWEPRLKEGILSVLWRFPRLEVKVQPATEPPHTALGLTGVPALVFVNDFTSIPIHTAQDTLDLLSPDEMASAAEVMGAVIHYLTTDAGAD